MESSPFQQVEDMLSHMAVFALVGELGDLAHSKLAYHLGQLRRGKWGYYRLNEEVLARFAQSLSSRWMLDPPAACEKSIVLAPRTRSDGKAPRPSWVGWSRTGWRGYRRTGRSRGPRALPACRGPSGAG